MKLHFRIRDFFCAIMIVAMSAFLTLHCFAGGNFAFADDESSTSEEHFVTIYDNNAYLTIKTAARTVKDVLEKVNIAVGESDIVEPGLDTLVAGDDYHINIHRARPALVVDGMKRSYVMTASYDPKTIAREAGITVYDGDEITIETNQNFLEAGIASTYRIERNGGRTLTLEEALAYPTETRYDYNMAKGEKRLEQAGEEGRKVSVYEIQFENNVEVSRRLVSESVKAEPIPEIVVVGAKLSVSPEQETCVGWMREAGVPEEGLEAAIYIIYHESGCRVDAENTSSGAYGIPQALPGSKMSSAGDDWQTNPVTQIRWMNSYVTGRYGGWQQALEFKQTRGWY